MLEVKHLYKSFSGTDGRLSVIEDLSFSVEDGAFYMILGQSGCGKTTLLRMLGGFEQPDCGEILLDGVRKTEPGADRMMLFQSFDQLFPWFTLQENLVYAMKKAGLSKERGSWEEQARQYLAMAGLSGFEASYPHQLSGGMKQRGALARALCLHPGILLLDEPFSSLDAITKKKLGELLRRLTEQTGCTAVMVTHDISEALELGSTVAVLGRGSAGFRAEVRRGEGGFPADLRETLEAYLL